MNPYIKDNELIIPVDSEPKYHYWKGGQSIIATLGELDAPAHVFKKYSAYNGQSGDTCNCEKPAASATEVFYCLPCGASWKKS